VRLRNFVRILNSVINSFKHLKNPFVILEIPLKKTIKIIHKNGDVFEIKRNYFPSYVEIFEKFKYDGYWYKDNLKLKMSEPLVLRENFEDSYNVPGLKEKNILDIGGLNGESSIYFIKEKKVKKVFVYEPIEKNYEYLLENLKNNSVNNVFSYNIGVSNKNGNEIINSEYPPGSWGFGLPGNKYSVKINVESWDTILEKHKKDNIYLAKVDCEGGERYLVEANKELIKTIPHWVIETHSKKIKENIIELFESLGYKKINTKIGNTFYFKK
jgi:FkbM family methyltransferase